MVTEVVAARDSERRLTPRAPSVAVLTIGCKLNQAESESLAGELAAAGCRVTDRAEAADAFIINTCAVTHVAERKARHLVRLARRLSPDARIVVTGCYAETATPSAIAALGADVVLGNDEKLQAAVLILADAHEAPPASTTRLRTRSFVKIQEGCNDICAFCVVPRTRGRERSVPAADVIRTLKAVEADGVKEVVLTGTQLGAYSDGATGLAGLIELALARTSIPRLRLSSLQPQDIAPALLDLWRDPRLCPHFHIALQSGSDAVLSRMRRRYTTARFRESLAAIRARLPDAAITTDVLVGFPGETDENFAATLDFCRESAFAALHVFPFSARPGTLAARMPGQVSAPVKRERVRAMIALGEELRDVFLARFEGTMAEVLCEGRARGKRRQLIWEGLTGNYIRVLIPSEQSLENRLVAARFLRREGSGFWGEFQPSDGCARRTG